MDNIFLLPDHLTMSIGELLREQHSLTWNHEVYLPKETPWDLDTDVIIHNTPEGGPLETEGVEYVMGVHTLQDIVQNAQSKNPESSDADLLDAFLFYCESDAFIKFRKRE